VPVRSILVRSVRALSFVMAAVCAFVAGCNQRHVQLKVNAPISAGDVQEICALVRAQTSEPIAEIGEVTTEAYIPGVTPRQTVSIAANGERHETAIYPCPGRVWVFTHPPHGTPLWFDVYRKDGKWTIVKTERVTYR
jgi:hypothetical protein